MATKKKHHRPAKKEHHVTHAELAELARAAAEHKNDVVVKLAGRALAGNKAAAKECARLIVAAKSLGHGHRVVKHHGKGPTSQGVFTAE
jgi:hypothetical protein